MNTELVRSLQTCIDDCDRLINLSERDKERYHECTSGELLSMYIKVSDEIIKKVKTIKNQLYDLQLEAKIEE